MKKRIFAAMLAALMLMSAFSASAADAQYTYNGNSTHTSAAGTEACVYTDAVTPATCLYGGFTVHTCEKCGHNYKDTYTVAPGAHQFTIWMIHDDATFTKDATETRRCTVCGETETRNAEGTAGYKMLFEFDLGVLGDAVKTLFNTVVAWGKLAIDIVKVIK